MIISKQKQIESILDWFNFERVHKTMIALDWKWCMSGHRCDIPEIGELRAAIDDSGQLSLTFEVADTSGGDIFHNVKFES